MSIETYLNDEIMNEFEELSKMKVGSDEYKTTVEGLAKLLDRAIEIDKHEDELQMKLDDKEKEVELKMKQIEDERKDRLRKDGIAIAGIVIPSLITIWGTVKSLKFEEEGTITTIMGRGFIQKLLPKK